MPGLLHCCVMLITLSISVCAWSKAQVVVISPHRSIQQEVVPRFKAFYLEKFREPVEVEWLDQGGASEALKYVLVRYEKNPKSAMIDLFWGGGEQPHLELKRQQFLKSYPISQEIKKDIPSHLGAIPIYDNEETWHAVNFSSFGVFYNKKMLKLLKIEEPTGWENLGDLKFLNYLSNADPRRSSSHLTMYTIILQTLGWEKGWDLLTRIAINTHKFAQSSSSPVKAVIAGEAIAGLSIEYYALAKIGDLGADNLGFLLPANQSVMNVDPISMLRGAPNEKVAGRFIEFILSPQIQKLFLLRKGDKDGPTFSTLGRLAVSPQSYKETEGRRLVALNPFHLQMPPFVLDREHATKMQFVLADLIGTVLIDAHKELKETVNFLIKAGRVAELNKVTFPIKQEEVYQLADKWWDPSFRNQTINSWLVRAREIYQGLHSKK